MWNRIPGFTLPVVALLVLFAAEGTATGTSAVHRTTQERAAEVRSWWTPKRMDRAVDMSVIVARSSGGAGVSARSGNSRATGVAPAPVNPGLRHGAADDAPSAIGRIFFRWLGLKGSCTGSVIDTPSRRVVLTAAHCLQFLGIWSDYLYFVPEYWWGDRPYGTWAARTIWVTRPWARQQIWGAPNHDLGAIVTRVSRRGKRVGDVAGVLPYTAYPRRKGTTRIYGYPAGRNRGRELRVCAGRHTWAGPADSYRLPGPVGMAAWCNMAAGSSGGPWLSAYRDGKGGREWRVDGLTSRGWKGRMTSSWFGSHFRRLIHNAEHR